MHKVSHVDDELREGTTTGEPAVPEADALDLVPAELKKQSLRGIFFLTFSNFANLIVGFFASLVLVRLLTPADFGVVAVGSTATLLALALTDGGLAAGLVRRPEP